MISYHHDGSETLEDVVVEFLVTDGTHDDFFVYPEIDHPTKLLQRFPISVTPVDNGVPAIATNEMASSLDFLHSEDLPKGWGKYFGVRYTRKILEVEDRDTPPEGLRITVVEPPSYGLLVVAPPAAQKDEEGEKEEGDVTSTVAPPPGVAMATSLTQKTINDGRLFYILHPNSNATGDSFKFKVEDRGNNTLEEQVASLSWSVVRLGVEILEANETQGSVIIPIHRRGYLAHTSIIQVVVVNDSSTVDVATDLAAVSPGAPFAPSVVQFSPGQTSAFWSFSIKDDDLFEGEETLTLRLEEPSKTRLEDPRQVVLHLHDDEDVSTVEFSLSSMKVEEGVGEVVLKLVRSGDITHSMSVSCVTFQVTAKGSGSSKATGVGLHSGADYLSLNNDSPRTKLPAGSSGGECRVKILDDALHEDPEEFLVALVKPTGGVVGQRDVIVVTIEGDSSDVPVVFFEQPKYEVEEAAEKLEVILKRKGSDLRKMSSALVFTKSKGAKENEDFQPFEEKVFFPPGVTEARVVLFLWDDVARPRLEGPEEVELGILTTTNADLGSPSTAVVVIDDSNLDLPRFEFATSSLTVEEESDEVAVEVLRRGDTTGEAAVVCYTRQGTATTPQDFEERPKTNASLLFFGAGERSAMCSVSLVDDSSFEGQEQLRLVLGAAYSSLGAAALGRVQSVLINVTDEADRPSVEFESRRVSVREPALAGARRAVKVAILRKGDLGTPVALHVFTRDGTARAGKDYVALSQEIVFDVFESRVETEVVILGDIEEEHREVLNVILEGSPNASADFLAFGSRMTIYIQDRRVASATFPAPPVVMSLRHYLAAEAPAAAPLPASGASFPPPQPQGLPPPPPGIPLVCVTACHPQHPAYAQTAALCGQSIDSSLTTYTWRVSTPPLHHASAPLHHQEGVEEETEVEMEEGHAMEPLLYHAATNTLSHQEPPAAGHNASSASASASSGGPGRLLLGSLVLQDPPSPLISLNAHTFMAGTKEMVLDSIYFGAGSVVQCAARPLSPEGYQGLEIKSEPVGVTLEGGPCPSMSKGSLGAPPFTAKLYYGDSTGGADRRKRKGKRKEKRRRKEVGLEVVVPHTDGLLPLVSTRPLHNLPYTLGLPPPLLQANHPCSNLHSASATPRPPQEIDGDSDLPSEGEISPEAWEDFYDGPHEEPGSAPDEGAEGDLLDGVLPPETRRFYEALNLDTCTWYWTSWFSMSQLLEECGGRLVEQEEEGGPTGIHSRRLVTVEVPLYVSYVFHSPHMYSPWRRSDLSTSLRMSFAYDPSILRQEGVVASSPGVRGVLHPTAVTIRTDGTLHVLFDTEAKFEGGFVVAHPTSGLRSRVTRDDQPELPLTLTLLRSPQLGQRTPHQQWQFVSDYALHDYSGNYTVRLVSCVVDPQEPTGCARARVIPFRLQVTFEQVAQPVEQRFSLNAAMNVFRLSRLLDLAATAAASASAPAADSTTEIEEGGDAMSNNDTVVEVSDAYFRPGDRIYVQVELEEGGGSGLNLCLRRCWVCAGRRGYVPKYLPGRRLYGCLGPDSLVAHSFKVVDRDDPDTVQSGFGDTFFNVGDPAKGPEVRRHGKRNALEEEEAEADGEEQWKVMLEERHLKELLPVGADGFAFDVNPLFQVSDGLHWFVHCIYEVGSNERTAQSTFDASLDGGFLEDRPFPGSSEWLASHPLPAGRPRNYLHESVLTGPRKAPRGRRATEEGTAPPEVLDMGTRGKGTNMHRLDLHPEPRAKDSLQQVPPHRIVLIVVSGLVALGLFLSLIGVQLQSRRLQRR
ncbi:extracellular matrix protein 3-like [Oratosquilla oratoria]|uniref:extracellular matrix protein 3-like n=1 Tax=Oratosquilla oratoria TaxID=337810 RepID=UPI003F759A1B